METTIFLAQLIGFVFLVTGFSMIAKRKMMLHIFEDLVKNRALSYLFGVVVLILGFLIFTNHNLWNGTTEVIITLLGIDMIIESLAYIFFSKGTLEKMFKTFTNKDMYYTMAVLYFLLGGYLLGSGIGIF